MVHYVWLVRRGATVGGRTPLLPRLRYRCTARTEVPATRPRRRRGRGYLYMASGVAPSSLGLPRYLCGVGTVILPNVLCRTPTQPRHVLSERGALSILLALPLLISSRPCPSASRSEAPGLPTLLLHWWRLPGCRLQVPGPGPSRLPCPPATCVPALRCLACWPAWLLCSGVLPAHGFPAGLGVPCPGRSGLGADSR